MAGKKGKSGGSRKPKLSKRVQEEKRAKIQIDVLIKLLMQNAKGEVQMDSTRVRSIEILLKKTLPDLQSIELTGDDDRPVSFKDDTDITSKLLKALTDEQLKQFTTINNG